MWPPEIIALLYEQFYMLSVCLSSCIGKSARVIRQILVELHLLLLVNDF